MRMVLRYSMLVIVFVGVLGGSRAASAQGLSESTGVNQYFNNCARCHESAEVHQAPRTSVLKQMPPERIYESLVNGTMRSVAAELSDQDKRMIAEWVGGRKIDTGMAGAADKMPNACEVRPPVRSLTAPGWNGWGVDLRNSRAQSAAAAGLSPGQVSRLALKWTFGFPGATALYGQTVIDGRLYVTSNAGYVYSLDAETGCVHWSFRSQAVVRSGFSVGRMSRTSERLAIFFGDIHGAVYALDPSTGETIWRKQTDPHPLARITGTPVLHDGRLYVPVASLEEPESGQADYACCNFRGSLWALDAATGNPIWKTYVIPDEPKVVGKNSRGKDMLAPAGAGIWVTPVLDLKRRALYFGTGNAFSGTPSTANAIMAVHMDTGKILWSMQALPLDVWHNGCPQTIPGRAAGPGRAGGGGGAGRAGAIPYPPENCPNPTGPDWDFSAPPALATTADGRDIIIAPQKQGLVWALNPDNGAVLWKQDVAREIAGGRGETLFGGAVDHEKAYFGLVSGAHLALDLKTGEEVWYTPITRPTGRENKRGVVGAVTLIPGVLLSGAGDGVVRAVSSKTGQLLWQFDTAQEFKTVNGVVARGGSLASGGPIVANGMVFIGSGYPGFQGGDPGNVLLAFAPSVRLDIHADELKKRASAAQNHPSHLITNGQITARVYEPDAKAGFYRSTRFDWSGAIPSLQYKNHEYYGSWFTKITDIYDFGYEGPSDDVISAEFTAMVGPAEEFGVIGYTDAKPGGLFVKPGVGVLRRADETPYNHSKPYEIANGGKWDVKRGADSITFTHTVSEPAIDFGYVYTKVIRLAKGQPQMTIAHTWKNTGKTAVQTNVYNHNFMTLDRQPPGPDYAITFPFEPQRVQRGARASQPGATAAGQPPPAGRGLNPPNGSRCGQPQMQTLAAAQGNRLVYAKALEGAECFQAGFTGFDATAVAHHDIRIENTKVGAGVRITSDRPMSRFGYWSIRTVMAVEPYIDIRVDPGQDFTWTWTYDYFAK